MYSCDISFENTSVIATCARVTIQTYLKINISNDLKHPHIFIYEYSAMYIIL